MCQSSMLRYVHTRPRSDLQPQYDILSLSHDKVEIGLIPRPQPLSALTPATDADPNFTPQIDGVPARIQEDRVEDQEWASRESHSLR